MFSGLRRSKIWAGIARWAPDFLSGLHGHLAAARDELANIVHDLSLKAASARVRRWRKWAQSVVSDQSKLAFQWAKGRDLIPLLVPVMSDGELMADSQVLVDDEFRKWRRIWGKDPLGEFSEVQLNEPFCRGQRCLRLGRQFGPSQCSLRLAMMNGSHGLGVTCPMARLRRSSILASPWKT